MKIKLAEALLRRKELDQKVSQLAGINQKELFEIKVKRSQVTDSIEDVVAQVPKVSFQQVTHAFDHHAKSLRRIDAAIQQANWNTEIDVDESVMGDYIDPYIKDNK